ncbi:hypothetical protein C8R46DRAFT_1201116 [Mycena filopes]|nr:hypothetical protein C8R46DRAFT_1201116 [Mycena filopes]
MHPSLKSRYLDNLPPSQRRVAIAACADFHTFDDLERLLDLLSEQSLEERVRFLPVFYINLDPANIPNAAQLDGMTKTLQDSIQCAVESLERMAEGAGPELWPRAWAWYSFLHTYWDALDGLTPDKGMFYVSFLRGAGRLHDHQLTGKLITSTPGFRILVAKSWALLPAIGGKDPIYTIAVLQELYGFFPDANVGDPASFAEFIEGAGGRMADLAALVISYIHRILNPQSMLYSNVVAYVDRVITFICDADSFSRTKKQEWLIIPPGPFCRCLLDRGLIGALVAALRTLATKCHSDTIYVLRDCLKLLRRNQAVDAGLLQALMQCATRTSTDGFKSNLQQLLCVTIPQALVNCYVVLGIKAALPEITALVAKAPPAFRESLLNAGWIYVECLVQNRVAVPTDREPAKACDNIEVLRFCPYFWCNEIFAKAEFQRCSGCKSLYYCSSACQTADWKRRHRKACRFYGALELTERAEPELDPRERSYLRKLLHRDWEAAHIEVCAKQIKFMADNPPSALFLTLFDYSRRTVDVTVDVEVHAIPDSQAARALKAQAPYEWADIVARARNSGGRMHVHVMRVPAGAGEGVMRYWVVPLRSNSAAIHETLRLMAPGMPEDRGAILALMEKEDTALLKLKVDEIH